MKRRTEFPANTHPGHLTRGEHLRGCLLAAPARGCGGVFRCATCRELVGWCQGATDAYPDDCDDCSNTKADRADLRIDLRQDTADRSAPTGANHGDDTMKKPKKTAAKTSRKTKTSTRAATVQLTKAQVAGRLSAYAKEHGMAKEEAGLKLMTIVFGRLDALSRDRAKHAKPAKKTAKRAAKASACRRAEASRVRASAGPTLARPSPLCLSPGSMSFERPSLPAWDGSLITQIL